MIQFALAALSLKAQIQDNKVLQGNSPKANIQLGNNNVNKHDNRKYNNTKTTKNVDNYNAPLITGDNPYVTINNIYPNKDSIKYEFEVKKKAIREALSDFMLDGYNLKNHCFHDTIFAKLNSAYKIWSDTVSKFLNEKLDCSYARQFDLAETAEVFLISLGNQSEEFTKLWQYIYAKIQKLDSFITSLY